MLSALFRNPSRSLLTSGKRTARTLFLGSSPRNRPRGDAETFAVAGDRFSFSFSARERGLPFAGTTAAAFFRRGLAAVACSESPPQHESASNETTAVHRDRARRDIPVLPAEELHPIGRLPCWYRRGEETGEDDWPLPDRKSLFGRNLRARSIAEAVLPRNGFFPASRGPSTLSSLFPQAAPERAITFLRPGAQGAASSRAADAGARDGGRSAVSSRHRAPRRSAHRSRISWSRA